MGDLAGALTVGVNELPLNGVEGVVLEHMNFGQVHAPHGLDGAFFQIATTMDVEIFIGSVLCNERAVVGPPLGKFTLKAELNPAITLRHTNP